jgi:hypothetical protein
MLPLPLLVIKAWPLGSIARWPNTSAKAKLDKPTFLK